MSFSCSDAGIHINRNTSTHSLPVMDKDIATKSKFNNDPHEDNNKKCIDDVMNNHGEINRFTTGTLAEEHRYMTSISVDWVYPLCSYMTMTLVSGGVGGVLSMLFSMDTFYLSLAVGDRTTKWMTNNVSKQS